MGFFYRIWFGLLWFSSGNGEIRFLYSSVGLFFRVGVVISVEVLVEWDVDLRPRGIKYIFDLIV
jgi:hypothetical protein